MIEPNAASLTFAQAASAAREVLGDVDLTGLALHSRRNRLVFDVFGADGKPLAVVDAKEGGVCTDVGAEQAGRIALDDFRFPAKIESAELIHDDPPLEYRQKRLPAYRVVLDHAKAPHIYVCAVTGEVLARRNRSWRIFDFFWMLHIMDYGQRENFNHWLLTLASALAVATSSSGLLLWGLRITRKRNRSA